MAYFIYLFNMSSQVFSIIIIIARCNRTLKINNCRREEAEDEDETCGTKKELLFIIFPYSSSLLLLFLFINSIKQNIRTPCGQY